MTNFLYSTTNLIPTRLMKTSENSTLNREVTVEEFQNLSEEMIFEALFDLKYPNTPKKMREWFLQPEQRKSLLKIWKEQNKQ